MIKGLDVVKTLSESLILSRATFLLRVHTDWLLYIVLLMVCFLSLTHCIAAYKHSEAAALSQLWHKAGTE